MCILSFVVDNSTLPKLSNFLSSLKLFMLRDAREGGFNEYVTVHYYKLKVREWVKKVNFCVTFLMNHPIKFRITDINTSQLRLITVPRKQN